MTSSILHTDVLAALKTMPDNSYHGCLTDPPYGLSFMGHGWDHGVPSVDVWRELLRVLRPGAHVLAFGGTRTFHRLTCAIEDAGFEIRDCMMWLYGSGFPKSMGVKSHPPLSAASTEAAHQWSGQGTALKPAWEPIVVARKPLDGTVAQNVQRWGCGGLAIDACRVGAQVYTQEEWTQKGASRTTGATYGTHKPSDTPVPLGRWPANVILDEEAGAILDAQSGNRKSASNTKPSTGGTIMSGLTGEARPNGYRAFADGNPYRGEEGGASRFFYCPKSSKTERNAGVDDGNVHPTVKPLALARYLARLILPPIPDARMVTPFCGSGSEVIGALQAGWSHVDGIDSWDVAVDIARARVEHWSK